MNCSFERVYKLEQILEAIMIKLEPEFSETIEQGLTASQFKIMRLLQREDLTLSELSELMEVTLEEIRTVTDRMSYAGLVLKNTEEAGTRDAKFCLTDKGVLTYKKCWDKRDTLINKYFLPLDKADQVKLTEILTRILKIE